jgi:hypothetical protein
LGPDEGIDADCDGLDDRWMGESPTIARLKSSLATLIDLG